MKKSCAHTVLATGEGTGAVSWLNYAFRLMYLPIGLFGVSIATAAVPTLSSLAARDDLADMRATISSGLRMMLMLNVPATVGLIALAQPIVGLIFQRGAFTADDTAATAAALTFYAPGLLGYSAVKLAAPAFYALQDSRTPVVISALSVAANVVLNVTLVRLIGYRGLALGTAIAALLNALPESPRWLVQQAREGEARDILSRLGGAGHAETELAAIRAANREEKGELSELFTSAYIKPLLIAVVLTGSQFCGINAIIYYSSKIFESAGLVKNAAFTSTVWIGLVNLLFTFVAIAFVDNAGRRPLLLIGTAVQTLALALVSWMFHTQQSGLPLPFCIMAFTAAFAMAMGPIPWIMCGPAAGRAKRALDTGLTGDSAPGPVISWRLA